MFWGSKAGDELNKLKEEADALEAEKTQFNLFEVPAEKKEDNEESEEPQELNLE
jgi:hypothetical protein